MTREEAIRLIGWLKCTTNREDDLEAIDMAIEALQKDIERHERVIRASERHLGIVRCKDCRWYKYDSYCSKTEAREIDADNFCSYGERRENV